MCITLCQQWVSDKYHNVHEVIRKCLCRGVTVTHGYQLPCLLNKSRSLISFHLNVADPERNCPLRNCPMLPLSPTGIFVSENDKVIFRTDTSHRTNYWSEWAQIWYGCPFWLSIWSYWDVYWIWLRIQDTGYPYDLGGPRRPKKFNFFFKTWIFLKTWSLRCLFRKKWVPVSYIFSIFWWISGVFRSYWVTQGGSRRLKNLKESR